MALTKYKFGELIELTNQKNTDNKYGKDDAIGVNMEKVIKPMRGNIDGKDFAKFHIVPPRHFAYNPRGGRKLGLGFNNTEDTYIITFNDNVFKIKDSAKNIIIDDYLYMYLCRTEWDRFAEFISWGSSTVVFDWNEFCDVDISLPPLEIQKKYVDIYNAMVSNQECYERGLEDLKLTCDAYIEDLRRKMPCEEIGPYITRQDIRNGENGTKNVMGVSTSKEFREPTSKVNRNELSNYKVVKPRQISFVQTTHNEKVFCNAFNNTDEDIVVTSVNEVFYTDESRLLPEYLVMFFNRTEFDRYARFHSWGSARETFTWDDLIKVRIPIADINIQKDIVDIFTVYKERKNINDRLKAQIKDICPILIKGSIEEARKEA